MNLSLLSLNCAVNYQNIKFHEWHSFGSTLFKGLDYETFK